ncbi:MAG: hypothetical protein WCJ30_07040 [Deltaproteobacteria bacterium]
MKNESKKTSNARNHRNDSSHDSHITEETTMNTKTIETTNTTDSTVNPAITQDSAAPSVTSDLATATDPRELAAYTQMLPLAREIDPKDLIPVNLDIPTVASTCLAVAERLGPYRAALARLPSYDIGAFDTLGTAALALAVAQADHTYASSPKDSLGTIVDRGILLRRSFGLWGSALADIGLVHRGQLDSIPNAPGYRELAVELTTYVRMFRASDWADIKSKSGLTDALLSEAESISQRILVIVGDRELIPARIAQAAEIRQRMFTLCVRRYDTVRRGVGFVRWEQGDADELAPSLYVRGPRTPAAKPTPASPPSPGPVTAPSTPRAPSAPVTSTTSGTPATSAPAMPAPQAVGFPNSSPFTAG